MNGVLRIDASEAREGDELIAGPQGPVDGNPTITSLSMSANAILVALLGDDGEYTSAVWSHDSRLAVYRAPEPEAPNGWDAARAILANPYEYPRGAIATVLAGAMERAQVALGELGEARMKDGDARDAGIGRAEDILAGRVTP